MRTLVLLCSLGAPALLVAPRPAHAAPAADPAPTVRLVVDASELGETSGVYEDVVGNELRAALERAGYGLDESVRADATVRVRIVFYNEADLDYQIAVDISAGAELVRLDTVGCPQCADEDLVAKIDEATPAIVEGLEGVLAQATPEGGTPPVDNATAPDPDARDEERAPITAIGGAGIGLAALGLGTLVAGGVEFGRGRVYDEPTKIALEDTFVDHRPPGIALMGVGGALAVVGATMLALDLIRANERSKARSVRAHPLASPALVGLGVMGRF